MYEYGTCGDAEVCIGENSLYHTILLLSIQVKNVHLHYTIVQIRCIILYYVFLKFLVLCITQTEVVDIQVKCYYLPAYLIASVAFLWLSKNLERKSRFSAEQS